MAPPRDVTRVANNVEGQRALQMGARVGYAVSGVLHLLIGLDRLAGRMVCQPQVG